MEKKPESGLHRPNIILASGSPRRRELLEGLGWAFTVILPDVDEDIEGAPDEMVSELCERKARAIPKGKSKGIVLAADTLVAIDGKVLGKPSDTEDARRMLLALSGREHEVLTGVCMINLISGRMEKQIAITKVWFRVLTEAEIDDYIATGEPMDKAGAYGIQGRAGMFVDQIQGSYENVMGLPVQLLPDMLARLTSDS